MHNFIENQEKFSKKIKILLLNECLDVIKSFLEQSVKLLRIIGLSRDVNRIEDEAQVMKPVDEVIQPDETISWHQLSKS